MIASTKNQTSDRPFTNQNHDRHFKNHIAIAPSTPKITIASKKIRQRSH
ncbi:hypothetical protein H6F44_17155 [Pseudanabaena sp. FACHB-1277]|jgi:hypothetical protein|uniref:Uncharacterized protein n=1 Tax=Pseudanabaena cinerea FACHB-1277 TaxID=2949581 RepID=A0A926UVV7_9CYAN|nr:hypothetical protein [Pseudanabaena cinerea]MBD2151838.1 hypothetical protein [Pseudanabaena cinerea FACHB-1277]